MWLEKLQMVQVTSSRTLVLKFFSGGNVMVLEEVKILSNTPLTEEELEKEVASFVETRQDDGKSYVRLDTALHVAVPCVH
jgi:hypothetical protein